MDPKMSRIVSSFPPPPYLPLPSTQVYKSGLKPDWKLLKTHFSQEGTLAKPDALKIISQVSMLLKAEPNLLSLQDPVTVVGDIHGQYYDLLKLLELGGNPEQTKYLFLGDYVDRGMFSIEVILLLYALKINFPSTILLLRGNHECRQMTSMFSFRKECLYKFDLEVYESFMESFDMLPMSCILNNSFLAVHGGISPELISVKDIQNLNRFVEPPKSGLQCDLLWSDPVDSNDGKIPEVYKNNGSRGCSYYFGGEASRKFLKDNDLVSIIRAHEAQKDGYKMQFWNGPDFPSLITIFSAPNYCDCYKNKGAIIKFDNSTLNIQQYNFSKHPYILPDFLDVFTWSVPFVIDKILQMLDSVIRPHEKIFLSFDEVSIVRVKELEIEIAKSEEFSKVTIEKFLSFLQDLKEKKKSIVAKQVFDDQQQGKVPELPKPVIPVLEADNDLFIRARITDSINEMWPY